MFGKKVYICMKVTICMKVCVKKMTELGMIKIINRLFPPKVDILNFAKLFSYWSFDPQQVFYPFIFVQCFLNYANSLIRNYKGQIFKIKFWKL